jgi:hypothetical protein
MITTLPVMGNIAFVDKFPPMHKFFFISVPPSTIRSALIFGGGPHTASYPPVKCNVFNVSDIVKFRRSRKKKIVWSIYWLVCTGKQLPIMDGKPMRAG